MIDDRLTDRTQFSSPPGVAGIQCTVNWEGGEGALFIPAGYLEHEGGTSGNAELGNTGKILDAQVHLPDSAGQPLGIVAGTPKCKRHSAHLRRLLTSGKIQLP